jgi:DNA recombination protein RmuC
MIILIIIIIALEAVLVYLLVSWRKSFKTSLDNSENLAKELNTISDRIGKLIGDEMQRNRNEFGESQRTARQELANQLKLMADGVEGRLDKTRASVDEKLSAIQDGNEKKLEQMRQTVDEKLHATLEKRFGESFKMVSEQLGLVTKNLGEMQVIAASVSDLKKVLGNVKSRGSMGEIQLGALLEDVLAPDQYVKNAQVRKNTAERVEFAVKLPNLLLPIDAKFPVEDYQRLVEAQEKGDIEAVEAAGKALEVRIRSQAKDIRDKYINPPTTTNFAFLFLPFESLFAEVLRRPGLFERIQHDYAVTIAGPTTMQANLNALRMGFQTLSIQKKSNEVWKLLNGVQTEFGKFGGLLEKTQRKLEEAGKTLGEAQLKTKTIEGKLGRIGDLPPEAAIAGTLKDGT